MNIEHNSSNQDYITGNIIDLSFQDNYVNYPTERKHHLDDNLNSYLEYENYMNQEINYRSAA